MKRGIKIITIIFISIIAFFSLAIPFYVGSEFQEKIKFSFSLISGISTLITLFIALILFNKFGVDKSIVDKKFDTVIELLVEIKKLRFLLYSKSGNFIQFSPHEKNWTKRHVEMFGDVPLVFGMSYINGSEKIINLADSIFMPKIISEKLEPLRWSIIDHNNIDKFDDYMKVVIQGFNLKSDDISFGIMNAKNISETMTLKDFARHWELVIDEIKKWLKDNSHFSAELNI